VPDSRTISTPDPIQNQGFKRRSIAEVMPGTKSERASIVPEAKVTIYLLNICKVGRYELNSLIMGNPNPIFIFSR